MFRPRLRSILVPLVMIGLVLTAAPASSGSDDITPVRIIQTSKFAKPSTDPSGLALMPSTGALVMVDSEVEEGPHWERANIWFWKPGKGVTRAFRTTRFSTEPTDVGLSSTGKVLAITDDTQNRVFLWGKGRDGRWGSDDDRVRELQTRHFGSYDPTGAAFGANSLFITDGDNAVSDHEVYRLRGGPNGRIDGAAPQGDDFVTSFDTRPLGIDSPTDVVYQSGSRHLFLVSADEDIIVEATLRGEHVETYDMSGTTLRSAAGIAFARASAGSGRHLYVADRGRDNEDFPSENDGRIFEFEI